MAEQVEGLKYHANIMALARGDAAFQWHKLAFVYPVAEKLSVHEYGASLIALKVTHASEEARFTGARGT
jgi:hypothetical protein